jgi:hypothetical protein
VKSDSKRETYQEGCFFHSMRNRTGPVPEYRSALTNWHNCEPQKDFIAFVHATQNTTTAETGGNIESSAGFAVPKCELLCLAGTWQHIERASLDKLIPGMRSYTAPEAETSTGEYNWICVRHWSEILATPRRCIVLRVGYEINLYTLCRRKWTASVV